MDKIFYLLCTAIIIFLLTAFSYSPPQRLTLDKYCHPQLSLCVYCPLFTPISIKHTFNVQAYIFSIEKIAFLTSKPGAHFKKILCKEYLNAVTPSLTFNTNQGFEQYYTHGQIGFRSENTIPFLRRYIPQTIQGFGDFIIFSRNVGDIQPSAYLEVSLNTEHLLKYARIMGWSVLLTIVIVFIDQKLGFDLFFKNSISSPVLEITTIGTSLLFSNSSEFFGFFTIAEAMYLAVIYLKLHNSSKISRPYIAIWMLGCIFWKNLVIAGYFYVTISQLREWKRENFRQNKMIGVLMAIGFSLKCFQAVLSVGFIVFLSNLWNIIVFPVCLLILQANSHDKLEVLQQDCPKK